MIAFRIFETGVVDLRKSIGEETAHDLLSTVHHIPVVDNGSLLGALVPDGTHDEESWLANSFKDTKQGPSSNESRKAEAQSVTAKDS